MTLRTAGRALVRRPGFTLLAVGALALGVAGTTAVYSLVHNVLFEGLPFPEAERLVTPDVRSPQGYVISISIPNYRDWTERSRVLERYGGSAGWSFVRQGADGSAETLRARAVIGDFFETLGLRADQGRIIRAADTQPGEPAVAVLGHGFWQRAYGGRDVIGETLVTDELTATIVGVLPPGAGYPSAEVEAYVPMGIMAHDLPWDDRTSSFGTRLIGRLAPGVTLAEAQADLNRVAREVADEEGRAVATPELRLLEDLFLGDIRGGLWLLMGAVGLLLLIACANIANLALARGEGRDRELAVRSALGARRGPLVRLLLTESALLAAAGGALGIVLAALTIRTLPTLLPLDLPALVVHRVRLDAPVLAFAVGVTIVSALLFGLAPALRLAGGSRAAAPSMAALGHGRRLSGSRGARRMRDGLVVTQVALSLMLLVAAGLLTRSLGRLGQVDKGFEAESVLTTRLEVQEGAFPELDQRWAFYDALRQRLEASPDVEVAAATLLVPLRSGSWERLIASEGASLEREAMESVLYNVVTEDYFRTLGIPLLRGRGLERSDGPEAEGVVVIDETMAERFWPDQDPIGRRVAFETANPGDPPRWLTVVGVATNVRHYELESPSRIQAWVPMRQVPRSLDLSVVVKVREGAEAGGVALLRSAVTELAPGTALSDLRPLADIVDNRLGPSRALSTLTGLFAAFAVLLASLGIFGALSLAVARRRRELGVRMAVGASPRSVMGLVARYGLTLAGIGTVVGALGALAANRLLASLLFEVQPFDPAVYATVSVGLLATATLAALSPAARAARTDPVRVLREE